KLHFFGGAHFGHEMPPQSTSVSKPFLTRSVQTGARQVTLQTPLPQSPETTHFFPAVHLGHRPPPQSTSVSEPFCVVSAQVAVVHVLVVGEQNPVTQSAATLQFKPDPHLLGQLTPQSVS